MVFPAEMLVDYVRVYQRDDETNVGCDPKDYPTSTYISSHPDAYSSEFYVLFVSLMTCLNYVLQMPT